MKMNEMRLLLGVAFIVFFVNKSQHADAATSSAHLPMEARDDSGSQEEDFISTSYVLPNQIFNNGKPYYASKDPISGQLDFNAKKPAGIEPAVNEVIDPKEKIVLSSSSPNIHDFLNLPVKYSSSKFVYPLVSSSYANLKYQGSNKNYITNKKPTSVEATAITPTPGYQPQNHYTIPTTKLMAISSTSPTSTTTTTKASTTTTASTTSTTLKEPNPTIATTTTTATRPTSTSIATSTSVFTPPKHNITVATRPTTLPTRKKFIPTKKYTATTPTATSPTGGLRFPEQAAPQNNSNNAPRPTIATTTPTTTAFTTRQPTPSSAIFRTNSTSTSSTKFRPPNTRPPTAFTEQKAPAAPTQTAPLSSTTRIPNLDPADVYQTLGQKHTAALGNQQKPSMTLADIFNSLAEEESAVVSHNQAGQGFDAQGNLLQPISPSKPSPFAMQTTNQNRPFSTRPTIGTTIGPHGPTFQQQFNNDQKLISGSQENYSNEYVSYQVQQPNMLQYRPVPGAINNVVISPGQHSASFVLGSQQQVGSNAFGNVEKESLYGKERPVQYGTVINEPPPQKPGNFPVAQQPQPQKPGNFPAAQQPPTFQQLPPQGGNFGSQEEPPAPPSPYQQLPLIGGPSLRPQATKPHLSQAPQNQLNENADLKPQQPSTSFPQTSQPSLVPTADTPSASDTKELLVSTNIRFPLNDEQSEEQLTGPVVTGPPAGPHVNGHAQPLSLQQIKNSNNVVFPKTKDEDNSLGHASADQIQIQQHEVVTMNQHKQKLSFPQLPEHHTPSTHMEPPPPPQSLSGERPQQLRPNGPLPPYAYNEYTRKPIPGITRPNPDRHLPNILPQFRPNAKISNGHPGPNFNQEPGNIRIPPGQTLKRPPTAGAGAPQFAHRRQPLMQQQQQHQQRYPANRASDYPAAQEANRRIYRLPPYGGQGYQNVDRMYGRRPVPYTAVRPIADSYQLERHAPALNDNIYKTLTPQDPSVMPERMAAFEEEDLVINDPPQPVTPSKDRKGIDESKLEPVVTLQMLQSHKKPLSLSNDDTGSGEIQVPAEPETSEQILEKPSNGLYVVYPMGGKKDEASIETNDKSKDTLPAVAHIESGTGNEYQNTPFSVIRDQPQEPILKNKKPQSLQQQIKPQAIKDKFPYPIEKPDPSYTPNRVPGVLIAPRIVHGIYPSGTETPIAIAYTPTEPNPYRYKYSQKFSNVNLASSVIGEIRTDTQTEEGLNNDYDTRGQNFEKNFMAPFYPSVSLGTVTSAPSNGWNILPSTTEQPLYEKNKINRADIAEPNLTSTGGGVALADSGSDDTNSDAANKNFDNDNFQPELQGGFKPIYPPGYKLDDEHDAGQADRLQQYESKNRPLALANHMETSTSSTTTSSTTTTTTTAAPLTPKPALTSSTTPRPESAALKSSSTTTTRPTEAPKAATTTLKPKENSQPTEMTTSKPATATPTQRKKSTFETSLEALLFGDEEDFSDEARKQKAKAKNTPLSAPRMGPRNLRLS